MLYSKAVFRRGWILCVCTLFGAACVDIQGPQLSSISSNEVLSEVSVGSDIVVMMLGDSLKLTAIASAVDGSRIDVNVDNLTWISEDPSQVQVDSDGTLTAKVVTVTPVNVTVSYQHGPVTMVGTVSVEVTETKLEVTSLKLVSLDSNRVGALALLGSPRLRIELYNGGDLVVKGAKLAVRAKHPVKVNFVAKRSPEGEGVYIVNNDGGLLGSFWVRSSANLYGTIVSDSVEFLGVYPAALSSMSIAFQTVISDIVPWGEVIPFVHGYGGNRISLQPCALIVMQNIDFLGRQAADLVFSDSASKGDNCDPIEVSVLREGLKSIGLSSPVTLATGGNLYGFPAMSIGVRRSSNTGTVEVYARNSATKQRYPIEIKYHSINIGETPQ